MVLDWGRTWAYIVKEGYKRIHNQENVQLPKVGTVWKHIWKIPGPPKVIILLWRAATDCLSMKVKLLQKGIIDSATCPICHTHEETALHVLVVCDVAKLVMGSFKLGLVL